MDAELTYTLTAEDGSDIVCEFLDMITYEKKDYIVLLPEDEEDVYILEVVEIGDEEEYLPIDDDDLLDTLFELFKERNPEHNFED